MKSESHSLLSDSLRPHVLYNPWKSPGQNTGMGSLSLLQGIFPTQGSNPGLPYCRRILYQLSHQGSPRILEWVAYPFSRASSQPRYWTKVSYIAGRFFTSWVTREALLIVPVCVTFLLLFPSPETSFIFLPHPRPTLSVWLCQLSKIPPSLISPH